MRIKNIVFDMDGTILNTIEDLYIAVNFALEKNGYPTRTLEEVTSFVGNGVKLLIERAMPKDVTREQFDICFKDFKGYYDIHKNDNTKAYDGVIDTMKELKAMGINMAVVSNKFDQGVKELANNMFSGLLPVAIGESEKVAPKPDPSGVWLAMSKMGANFDDTVYIGDSDVDFNTAKNSKIDFIAVTWGFRPRSLHEKLGAKYIIDTPKEIIDTIKVM